MHIENHDFVLSLFQPWSRTIQFFLRTNVPISSKVVTIYPDQPFFPLTDINIGVTNSRQLKRCLEEVPGLRSSCWGKFQIFDIRFVKRKCENLPVHQCHSIERHTLGYPLTVDHVFLSLDASHP